MTPDERFRDRPRCPDMPQHHRRLALLRPWLQIRPGDRRNPRRPRDQGRNPATTFPVSLRRASERRDPLRWRGRDRLTFAAGQGAHTARTEGNAMLGLMQDWPLLCHRIIDHAATYHAERPVISRSIEGPIHTTNYAEIRKRALRVAQRLDRDGIKLGDRVATLAWNTWRHLECLVRHPRHRRDLSHRQSAAVPRPDRLDHQSRRRPRDDGRSHLRAAPGKARRQAADHRALCRADRRRAYAGDHAQERGRLRGLDRRGRRRFRMEDASTRIPPPACATPRAPPAIPRASSIRTAPTCCIR